ncbi:hypothetical protein [Phyllobacterium sp. SB3]|uniref:hypothetical protein n=1 Tax=Phyllobacterium sp. SB3 TaxID=3156073 RepID=UPI0032AF6D9B
MTINFDRVMDSVRVEGGIAIAEPDEQLPGALSLDQSGRALEFQPSNPWRIGSYEVRFSKRLERTRAATGLPKRWIKLTGFKFSTEFWGF